MADTKTILIADPGIDDAVAILVASALRKDVAFVATYGNGPTAITAKNYQGLLNFIHADLKHVDGLSETVYVGADRPTQAAAPFRGEDLSFIHGPHLSENMFAKNPSSTIPSSVLYQQLTKEKTPVTIFSFAAVTELAILLHQVTNPTQIQSITIMGGVLHGQGNVHPRVEANFAHDPEALITVLRMAQERAIPLTIVPLDVTEHPSLELTTQRVTTLTARLHDGSEKIADLLTRLAGPLTTYPNFYRQKRGVFNHRSPYEERFFHGSPLHDLTALFVHYFPELFQIGTRPLFAEKNGTISVPTAWMEERGVFCSVVLDVSNSTKYWDYVTKYLAAYD